MVDLNLEKTLFELHDWFTRSKKTLGFAESCTGGLVSSLVTRQAGASAYFLGSVISYHADVKRNVLGVSASDIKDFGEVSEPVARGMAKGANRVLATDWSVAITGIAGPGGGTSEKPIGRVCFAIAGPEFEQADTQTFTKAEWSAYAELENKSLSQRELIQTISAHHALKMLWAATRS